MNTARTVEWAREPIAAERHEIEWLCALHDLTWKDAERIVRRGQVPRCPTDAVRWQDPARWRRQREAARAAWASTLAQAREWQASGVPFHGDEPALDARDALVMALACRAVVAGVPTRDAFEGARVYVAMRGEA